MVACPGGTGPRQLEPSVSQLRQVCPAPLAPFLVCSRHSSIIGWQCPNVAWTPSQDLPTFLRGLIPHMAQHRGCPWPPGPWVHACAYSWGLVFTKSLAPAWTHGQKASLRVHSTGLGPGFSPFPLLCFPLKALFHGRTLHAVWHPCRGRHIIVFS